MKYFVLSILLSVLALLVCPAAMNCAVDAISAVRVDLLLFAAVAVLIGLFARSL